MKQWLKLHGALVLLGLWLTILFSPGSTGGEPVDYWGVIVLILVGFVTIPVLVFLLLKSYLDNPA